MSKYWVQLKTVTYFIKIKYARECKDKTFKTIHMSKVWAAVKTYVFKSIDGLTDFTKKE